MTDIVQCRRCKKIVIEEEYDKHECEPLIKNSKTIQISSYYITKDNLDRDTIHAWGLDGTVLDLVIIPEDKNSTKIPYQPTGNREKSTDKETVPVL